MKSHEIRTKKITAVLAAFAIILIAFFSLSLSGCGYSIKYDYKVEYEGGEGYYVVTTSGYVSSIGGELVIPSTYGEGEKQAPVKEIADEAFRGAAITRLVIPSSVTKIGVAAFANCNNLEEVVFESGSNLKEIPQGMFGFDGHLAKITLPASVKSIGYRAFCGCDSLNEVNLSENLEKIASGAFEDCYSLTAITLPEGLVSIGSLAFYNCGIKEIVIPDSVRDTQIPVTDENGNPTTDKDGAPVTKTVYGLDYGAFHSCRALEKAVVGSGITAIKSGVFGFCDKLSEVYIPSSVKKIEGAYVSDGKFIIGHAFHNCAALSSVNYSGTTEEWGKIDINNTNYNNNGANYNNNALFKEVNTKLNFSYGKSYAA